jgi:hypothetical protein
MRAWRLSHPERHSGGCITDADEYERTRWMYAHPFTCPPSPPRTPHAAYVYLPPSHALCLFYTFSRTNCVVWGADAAEFRPERFESVGKLRQGRPIGVPGGDSFGFVPFGAGPRTCVGQRLAMMEAVQILASVVKHFDFKLGADKATVDECADVTLGPKNGLSVIFTTRGAALGSAARSRL